MINIATHPAHHDSRASAWPEVTANGAVVHRSQLNVAAGLARLGVAVFFDEFANRVMATRAATSVELNDVELNRLYFDLDALGLKPPKPWYIDCVLNRAHADRRNEVRDRLKALVWDRQARLDGWLVRHAEGEDTPFARAAFKHQMMAGVARIYSPGIKHDQIAVFAGPQGGGKSSFLRILAGGYQYFTDALPVGASDKETLEIAHGKTIVELGELAGLGKRDHASVKAFASRQADRARPAYGRTAVETPRQFTCWGTTNDTEYLEDPTGNRRFWPLRVGKFDLEGAKAERDLLWAEAAHLVSSGHQLALPDHLWSAAAQVQSERVVGDVWEEVIERKLDDHAHRPVKVTSADVLMAIGLPTDRQDRQAQMRTAKIMRKLGFAPCQVGKRRHKAWLRGDGAEAVRILCRETKGQFVVIGVTNERHQSSARRRTPVAHPTRLYL